MMKLVYSSLGKRFEFVEEEEEEKMERLKPNTLLCIKSAIMYKICK